MLQLWHCLASWTHNNATHDWWLNILNAILTASPIILLCLILLFERYPSTVSYTSLFFSPVLRSFTEECSFTKDSPVNAAWVSFQSELVTLWLMVQLPHPPLWWTSHGNHVYLTEEVFLTSKWICALMSQRSLSYAQSYCITQLHQILMHSVDIPQRTQTSDKVDQVSNPHATLCTAHHSQDEEYLRPVMYTLRQAHERT